nr:MAG TPA: hypothetical protein [Caudoviricetes sp.]
MSVLTDFFHFCGYNGNKKELAKASPKPLIRQLYHKFKTTN